MIFEPPRSTGCQKSAWRRHGLALFYALLLHAVLLLGLFWEASSVSHTSGASPFASALERSPLVGIEVSLGLVQAKQLSEREPTRSLRAPRLPTRKGAVAGRLARAADGAWQPRSDARPAASDKSTRAAVARRRSERIGPASPAADRARAGHVQATREARAAELHAGSGAQQRSLSLQQLGVDSGNGDVLPKFSVPATTHRLAEQRLRRSMAQASLDRDQMLGLGAEGPVVTAMVSAAMGKVPPRSRARFEAVVGADGLLESVRLLEVSRGFNDWSDAVKTVRNRLRARRVRNLTGRRLALEFEVESKVALPSGRSPGAGLSVLGIPIVSKGAEDSPSIDVLKPQLKLRPATPQRFEIGGTLPEQPGVELGIALFSLNGDLVDVGAVARQVVKARLVRQTVL